MTRLEGKLRPREKAGYALGDAAANLVWRGALAFLAVFYTDTFGISALAVGVLLLVVRLQDGMTDIIMGMIADRTTSRWGKFRPWVLFSAPVLGLFMVLTFTTPHFGNTGKLIWAYVTYVGLTLAYTANNVPYSALMGVMTPNPVERTNLSSWRFAGAFTGGFLVMVGTPLLVARLGGGNDATGYQYAMYLFAALLVVMLAGTFFATRERVAPPPGRRGGLDANPCAGAAGDDGAREAVRPRLPGEHDVDTIAVSAPEPVLRQRLADRRREPQAFRDSRLARADLEVRAARLHTFDNDGPLEDTAPRFVRLLQHILSAPPGSQSAGEIDPRADAGNDESFSGGT